MTVKLIPYLNMEGNAREAIQFYQRAIDAEVLSTRYLWRNARYA